MDKNIAVIILLAVLIIFIFGHLPNDIPNVRINKGGFYVLESGIPGPCVGIITGVHGNERSGPIEILNSVANGNILNHIRCGRAKIIPCANLHGFKWNTRWRNMAMEDLNRIFNTNDKQILAILNFFSDCDIVLDIHEGFDWHLINSESVGNTITPTESANEVAEKIVKALNSNPIVANINFKDSRKRYTINTKNIICSFSGALSCWMNKHQRKYILMEIAGQNNIQPINVRREMVRVAINTLFEYENMLNQ